MPCARSARYSSSSTNSCAPWGKARARTPFMQLCSRLCRDPATPVSRWDRRWRGPEGSASSPDVGSLQSRQAARGTWICVVVIRYQHDLDYCCSKTYPRLRNGFAIRLSNVGSRAKIEILARFKAPKAKQCDSVSLQNPSSNCSSLNEFAIGFVPLGFKAATRHNALAWS